jgi:hypothetical protein
MFIACLVIAAATLADNAEETSISEKSFGCIRDSAVKVEGTFIRHADPARLKEAVQIFEGEVADKEYPVVRPSNSFRAKPWSRSPKRSSPIPMDGNSSPSPSQRTAPRSPVGATPRRIPRAPVSVATSRQLSSTMSAKETTVARVSRSRMSKSPRCKTTTLAARSDTLEEKLLKYETNS